MMRLKGLDNSKNKGECLWKLQEKIERMDCPTLWLKAFDKEEGSYGIYKRKMPGVQKHLESRFKT